MAVNKEKEDVIRFQMRSAQQKINRIVESFTHSVGRYDDAEVHKTIDAVLDNLEVVKLLLEKGKK